MIYRNCAWVVVANRRQFSDSHDILLQEVIIVKKWIKENHSYHELPHEGDEKTRISAEPGFLQNPRATGLQQTESDITF